MATPVLSELRAGISDLTGRLHRAGGRLVEDRRGRIETLGRSLARVPDLLELADQRFTLARSRLGAALERNVAVHRTSLVRVGSRLNPALLQRPQTVHQDRLTRLTARLQPAMTRAVDRARERLVSLSKLHLSVDPSAPLKRGFARVHRLDGGLVREGAGLSAGEAVRLVFADVDRNAVIDGTGSAEVPAPKTPPRPVKSVRPPPTPPNQGDLF